MPSTTFENLNLEKKKHINDALLMEFSNHSLANAQVARIVSQASIARGAFYKYFADLRDAYEYTYHVAIENIHANIISSQHQLTAHDYVNQVRAFLSEINESKYRNFMKLHFQTNEGLLRDNVVPRIRPHSSLEWGVMVLCHETIKDGLLQPTKQEEALDRLATALSALLQ